MNTKPANKALYWLIGVLIVAVVIFSGYKIWHHYNRQVALRYPSVGMNNRAVSPNPVASQAANSGSNQGGLSNKTDTSNQQLNQDLQNIQNSMNQLQQDQNTANQDSNNQSLDTPQQ